MINAATILSNLAPYQGTRVMVKKDQSTDDIISGILQTHKKWRHEYDKIYSYFIGVDIYGTCNNIWDFLKYNTVYEIESEKIQILKSPSAILGSVNNDCKSLALFTGGILSAISRNTNIKIPFCYRFASYAYAQDEPEHVFVVVNPGTNNEIWIDPVLSFFDYHKMPYCYYDYKPSDMSLYKMAGLPDQILDAGVNVATGNPVGIASSVIDIFSSIISGSKANPNDWQGWASLDTSNNLPIGTNAQSWVKQNGDDPKNEALNISQWIQRYGISSVVNQNQNIISRFGSATTLQEVANKLINAGYITEAKALQNVSNNNSNNNSTQGLNSSSGSNINLYLLLGAGIVAIYLFTKKR